MGIGINLHCPKCDYSFSAMLGIGRLFSSLENALSIVHHSERNAVLDILNNHAVDETDFYHALFQCPECRRLYNQFYYRIRYDGDQVLDSSPTCPVCRVALSDVSGGKELRCPNCSDGILESRESLHWD